MTMFRMCLMCFIRWTKRDALLIHAPCEINVHVHVDLPYISRTHAHLWVQCRSTLSRVCICTHTVTHVWDLRRICTDFTRKVCVWRASCLVHRSFMYTCTFLVTLVILFSGIYAGQHFPCPMKCDDRTNLPFTGVQGLKTDFQIQGDEKAKWSNITMNFLKRTSARKVLFLVQISIIEGAVNWNFMRQNFCGLYYLQIAPILQNSLLYVISNTLSGLPVKF